MPLRAVKRRDFVPDEFVFFGRLEPRKGLPLFCDAIDRLAKRACVLPRITFLGGAARRFDGPGYIQKRSGLWDCDVSVLSQMGPDEAMAYLRGGKRLSVIPSLLENSSMAVMECLAQGIPFISCATGGTPELIRPEDRRLALCAPSAESLAGMLEKVLGNGAGSVRSSYELQGSNDVWRRWHRSLPRPLRCVQRVGTESAVFIKDKAARVDASVEQRFRSAMSCSAADIVTSFYRVCRPWRSRDVICLGDLITGELSNDGVAGPCCLISREAADVLDVDLQRPDFAKLYRRALLAGFDLDMVPEVLFEVRRWR